MKVAVDSGKAYLVTHFIAYVGQGSMGLPQAVLYRTPNGVAFSYLFCHSYSQAFQNCGFPEWTHHDHLAFGVNRCYPVCCPVVLSIIILLFTAPLSCKAYVILCHTRTYPARFYPASIEIQCLGCL